MEDTIENLNSPNQEEVAPESEPEIGLPADPVEVEPIEEVADETDKDAVIADLKRKQQELYEQNRKLKGFVRGKDGKWVKKEQPPATSVDGTSSDITIMELKSLLAANISDDSDTEEVRLYARAHKLSITEALKMPEVKSMLKTRIEIRKTAEAANTKNTRYGSSKPTDDQIMSEAREGKLADPETMAEIRQRQRMAGLSK